MAALDEIDLTRVASTTDPTVAKRVFAQLFWDWYRSNKGRSIKLRKFGVRFSVRIEKLHDAFELIAGPDVSAAASARR